MIKLLTVFWNIILRKSGPEEVPGSNFLLVMTFIFFLLSQILVGFKMYQGIILLAVAFGHAQRNENSTGIGMLKRVLEKIEDSTQKYHSIDIERIRKKSLQMQKENKLSLFQI